MGEEEEEEDEGEVGEEKKEVVEDTNEGEQDDGVDPALMTATESKPVEGPAEYVDVMKVRRALAPVMPLAWQPLPFATLQDVLCAILQHVFRQVCSLVVNLLRSAYILI